MTATLTNNVSTRTNTPSKSGSRTAAVARALAGSALVACATTEALTGVVRAGGVHLAINTHAASGGTPIGFGACATMVAMVLAPTVLIVAAISRWATEPARTWYRVTAVLFAASFIPDLVEPGTSTATRLTLMTTHVVAAALIVPTVGRRLR
jgi:hypothetical protein